MLTLTYSSSATIELEEQLTSLGERWAQVCEWTTNRFTTLQNLLQDWNGFEREKKSFGDWLTEKETILTEMTLVRVETKDDILSRAKELKVRYSCGKKC